MSTRDILREYQNINIRRGEAIEVEARIQQNITFRQFNRLLQHFNLTQSTEVQTEIYPNDVRRVKNLFTGEERWERKFSRRPWIFYLPENIKVQLSIEQPTQRSNARPTIVRTKRQYTHLLDQYRIDLSITHEEQRTRYEVEVEWVPDQLNLDKINRLVAYTLELKRLLEGTRIYVPEAQKKQIISQYNRHLGLTGNYIRFPPTKPVDITFDNLTFEQFIPRRYWGSVKLDGERQLLFASTLGVFLISNDINKISERNIFGTDVIADGELLENTFHLFDVLYHRSLITNRSYPQRYAEIESILQAGKQVANITLQAKPISLISDVDSFYSVNNKLYLQSQQVPSDGFIYTPEADRYFEQKVLKWKPIERLTIDLQVIDVPPFVGVKNKENQIVPFHGTSQYRITAQNVDVAGLPLGTIAEFRWNQKSGKYEATKVRPDKEEPNYITVAERILRSIHNYVPVEALLGTDLTLMRKYHNREKNNLYDYLEKENVTSLVDFGSGRGGDVNKWRGRFDVVAVEPNEDNVVELRKRLVGQGYKQSGDTFRSEGSTVHVLNIGAEEYQCREPVQAVTMFNSLTFFYDTPQHVDVLLDNIDTCLTDGYLVLMALDGMKLKQIWPTGYQSDNIQIEYEGEQVLITLRASGIVTQQTEYVINFDDLIERLQQRNYVVVDDYYLDRERLLSEEEFTYSSMTRVLVLQRKMVTSRRIKELLPPLPPDQYELYRNPNIRMDLIRIGVIQDPSVLLHAILSALSPTYISLSLEERGLFVRDLRLNIADELEEYSSELESYYAFIGNQYLELLMRVLNINIFMTDAYTFDLLQYDYERELDSIFLLWQGEDRYEVIGILRDGQAQTVFPPGDTFAATLFTLV